MWPDLSGAIPTAGNAIGPKPGRITSSRCVATPAPPAVCRDVYGTFGTVAVMTLPAGGFPTTWVVALPLKLATPPGTGTLPGTHPFTRICCTSAPGPHA